MSPMFRAIDMSGEISTQYGIIEIGDLNTDNVPQWETGEERVVNSPEMVSVATRGDVDGPVQVRATSTPHVKSSTDVEVFDGEISVPSGVLTIGAAATFHDWQIAVPLSDAVGLRIFVSPAGSPEKVTVVLSIPDAVH